MCAWPCLAAVPTFAAEPAPSDFHRAVYALHERQIAQHAIRAEEETGAYEGFAAADYRYVDTRYYDAVTGQLLSHVRRDAAHPERIHVVEVNLYENGRLVRDFGSIALPWAPRRPERTMINLHHYNGGLHSFRQYDFFGQVGYEFCEGRFNGQAVHIALDGADINEANTATAAYKACFDGLREGWAEYRMPR